MRNGFFTILLCVPLALSGCAALDNQANDPKVQIQESPNTTQQSENPSYLFTVVAAVGSTVAGEPKQGEDESFLLTIDGVDSVTKFADRPLRAASVLSPEAFVLSWSSWFADSPPNAVLTFDGSAGMAPLSIVVTLTDPHYEAIGSKLIFTASRTYRTVEPSEKDKDWKRPATPLNFTNVSLFIDNSGDSQASPLVDILQQTMQQFVFSPNDANTWVAVQSALSAILTTAWQQGTLSGPTADSAFTVNCQAFTAQQILNGYLSCDVSMQLANGENYSTTLTQQMASSG